MFWSGVLRGQRTILGMPSQAELPSRNRCAPPRTDAGNVRGDGKGGKFQVSSFQFSARVSRSLTRSREAAKSIRRPCFPSRLRASAGDPDTGPIPSSEIAVHVPATERSAEPELGTQCSVHPVQARGRIADKTSADAADAADSDPSQISAASGPSADKREATSAAAMGIFYRRKPRERRHALRVLRGFA